jgi:hypothetical protein
MVMFFRGYEAGVRPALARAPPWEGIFWLGILEGGEGFTKIGG